MFHIINHATFKASLFMAAGIIDHEAGTRDMRRLHGLWAFMPYTATLAMVAAAAMAGVPLMNGFLSKEMFFVEAMEISESHVGGWLLPALVTLAGALAVAYSIRFIHDVFFNGEPVDLPRTPHEPPRWMKLPVEILVVLCLVVGIAPALTVAPLLAAAAADTLQAPLPEYRLALWHGFNQALAMSLIALAGGATIYALRARGSRCMNTASAASTHGWSTTRCSTPCLRGRDGPPAASTRLAAAAVFLFLRPRWRWASRRARQRHAARRQSRRPAARPVSLLAGATLIAASLATVWLPASASSR